MLNFLKIDLNSIYHAKFIQNYRGLRFIDICEKLWIKL